MEIELGGAGIRLSSEQAALLPQLARLANRVQRRGERDARLLAAALQGAGFLRPLDAVYHDKWAPAHRFMYTKK